MPEDAITHGVITMSVVIVTAGVEQLMQVAAVAHPGSAAPGRRTFGVADATELQQGKR